MIKFWLTVIDTSDNVEEFYTLKELREIYDRGIKIQGVSLVRNRFVVTPVEKTTDIVSATKNQFLVGSATGYEGFDLDLSNRDAISTKPLEKKFFDYVFKYKLHDNFILVIPDIVTIIGENFFDLRGVSMTSVNFSIVIPNTVKVIKSDALSSYFIANIEFQGVIDKIERSTLQRGSLSLNCNWLEDNTFYVRCLESYSIFLNVCKVLKLPMIECLDYNAINYNSYSTPISIHIGNKLKKLYSFIKPLDMYKGTNFERGSSITKKLMSRACILYLDYITNLEEIDMNIDKPAWACDMIYFVSYIFVIDKKMYADLMRLLHKNSLCDSIAIGIMTYENMDGKRYLEENLYECCSKHRKYFRNYLELGKINLLQLK